jgi:hypothetical protein
MVNGLLILTDLTAVLQKPVLNGLLIPHHPNDMKIPFDSEFIKPHNVIICKSYNCPYQRECANHFSAGDFRSEGGFSPELSMVNGEVHCATITQPVDIDIDYTCLPSNYNTLNSGCLFWKDINEEVDNYQI